MSEPQTLRRKPNLKLFIMPTRTLALLWLAPDQLRAFLELRYGATFNAVIRNRAHGTTDALPD